MSQYKKGNGDLGIVAIIVAIVAIGVIFMILLTPDSKKADDERTLGFKPMETIALVGSNQKAVVVYYNFMKPWFESAGQKVRIISINGIGQGSYGKDTYFLIVFEDVVPTQVESEKGIH